MQDTVVRTINNPMQSPTKSLRLPADLAEAAEIRAKLLGYKSWTDYLKALIRYDLMIQGPHTITLPISHSRPEEQDALDADLLERCRNGEGTRGQWLEKAIERIAGPAKADEVAKKIGREITKIVRKGGNMSD